MTVVYLKNRSQAVRLRNALISAGHHAVKRIIRVGDRFQLITDAPIEAVETIATGMKITVQQ